MPVDYIRDPEYLSDPEIENIEKLTLRWLFQATVDFGFDAAEIFYQSTDEPKDVAEDITREMLDRLGGYQIPQRILGNVDYRKARYIILPELLARQALFVDSKAEQTNRTATLQMSQTSMVVRQMRQGTGIQEQGKIPIIATYREARYLTTTLLAHYQYRDEEDHHVLQSVTLTAIPNGKLQEIYNPNPEETIWLVGRNADTRGEDFRVRLAFDRLEDRAVWRVQRVNFNLATRQIEYQWRE